MVERVIRTLNLNKVCEAVPCGCACYIMHNQNVLSLSFRDSRQSTSVHCCHNINISAQTQLLVTHSNVAFLAESVDDSTLVCSFRLLCAINASDGLSAVCVCRSTSCNSRLVLLN